MGVLSSLWEALEVEQEDVDRGIFERLMAGPARLHGKSIQKVIAVTAREKAYATTFSKSEVHCRSALHCVDCDASVCHSLSQSCLLCTPCFLAQQSSLQ